MHPIKFPQSNSTLRGGPAECYGTTQDVGDLPTYKDGDEIVSCWVASWRERLSLLLFGRLWLFVHTPSTHPPVALMAQRNAFEEGN